jgi:hypothetical protein
MPPDRTGTHHRWMSNVPVRPLRSTIARSSLAIATHHRLHNLPHRSGAVNDLRPARIRLRQAGDRGDCRGAPAGKAAGWRHLLGHGAATGTCQRVAVGPQSTFDGCSPGPSLPSGRATTSA